MNIYDTLLSKVRAYFMEALGYTADQVIPANDRGPRPELPYLTINITNVNTEVASSEEEGGKVYQMLSGVVQLDVYGFGGLDMLHRARAQMGARGVKRWLYDNALSISFDSSANDLSSLVDDQIEQRFSQDAAIYYTTADDVLLTVPDAEQFDTDYSGEESSLPLTYHGVQVYHGGFATTGEFIQTQTDWT